MTKKLFEVKRKENFNLHGVEFKQEKNNINPI